MKHLFTFFIAAFFTLTAQDAFADGIKWHTSYDQAVKLSESTSKPMVLFFTGSDWCGWCKKLEKEALDTPEFAEAAGEAFIFVKLDFPMKKSLDAAETAQNNELKKKYNVRGFPTLIILDNNQEPVGLTGYQTGGGKRYAEHLLKMVNAFSAYQKKMSNLESQAA